MDNHRSVMDRRTDLMGHMAVGFIVSIGQIGMTESEIAGSWIHLIGECFFYYNAL